MRAQPADLSPTASAPSCPARVPLIERDVEPSIWVLSALVFVSMVSSTMLIPAARPFVHHMHPGNEGALHAFMSVNMLGAIVGAPLLALWADRRGQRQRLVMLLALVDGALLFACSLPMPAWSMLSLRALQGAANVGGLSLLMGFVSGRGKAMGLAGAALMAAVAAGAPLGTLLLSVSPTAPLRWGALLPLAIAVSMWAVRLPVVERAPRVGFKVLLQRAPLLKVPIAFVTIERFCVGCFVVTFSLYAHRALGLSDVGTGKLYSWFLLPFAVATYPFGRLAETVKRSTLVASGALAYGICFVLLGVVPTSTLPVLLFATGIASAAMYAPCLCFASTLVDASMRSTSMGLLNAGGSLGMMVGTALGGMLSVVGVKKMGWAADAVYPAIFAAAGACALLALGVWMRDLLRADGADVDACAAELV